MTADNVWAAERWRMERLVQESYGQKMAPILNAFFRRIVAPTKICSDLSMVGEAILGLSGGQTARRTFIKDKLAILMYDFEFSDDQLKGFFWIKNYADELYEDLEPIIAEYELEMARLAAIA